MTITLIDEAGEPHEVEGSLQRVSAGGLTAATGWTLKPEGLCRGDVCVPLLGREVASGDDIDLVQWAAALGYQMAIDEGHDAVALAASPADADALGVGAQAPDLQLRDVDGQTHAFSEFAGRKRVLVTWASWCGCRHELGSWRELQDEFADDGLAVYSVALDNSADDARPWVEAGDPSYPVVVDPAHVTAERYGITNVPSVVWVDEDGRIVKPATISPVNNQFKDFTKIDAEGHREALRRWVRDDILPDTSGTASTARSSDEQLALAERRLAAWLIAQNDNEAAAAHLARAVELAPWDWTVRRGGIAMRGEDPFLGKEFTDFWERWDAAGRPGYVPMAGAG